MHEYNLENYTMQYRNRWLQGPRWLAGTHQITHERYLIKRMGFPIVLDDDLPAGGQSPAIWSLPREIHISPVKGQMVVLLR